jgi:hypothetical protein
MQTYLNRGDYENFWYFDLNEKQVREKANNLFLKLNNSVYK